MITLGVIEYQTTEVADDEIIVIYRGDDAYARTVKRSETYIDRIFRGREDSSPGYAEATVVRLYRRIRSRSRRLNGGETESVSISTGGNIAARILSLSLTALLCPEISRTL